MVLAPHASSIYVDVINKKRLYLVHKAPTFAGSGMWMLFMLLKLHANLKLRNSSTVKITCYLTFCFMSIGSKIFIFLCVCVCVHAFEEHKQELD